MHPFFGFQNEQYGKVKKIPERMQEATWSAGSTALKARPYWVLKEEMPITIDEQGSYWVVDAELLTWILVQGYGQ